MFALLENGLQFFFITTKTFAFDVYCGNIPSYRCQTSIYVYYPICNLTVRELDTHFIVMTFPLQNWCDFSYRGDHTSVDFYMAVVPPRTECVVFSIDGSFTASMSVTGRDPKVRAGAVDIVRWVKASCRVLVGLWF